MPPRPEGTDGSDHAYRMVIAERYKRMADFKHTIQRLLATHVALEVVKTAWTAIGMLEGYPVPFYAWGTLVGDVVVVFIYLAAKLGTVKESLLLLKIYNLAQALVVASHILNSWRYHNGLNLEPQRYSRIAAHWISNNTSALGYSPAAVLQVTQGVELFLDLTLGVFLLMATLVSHRMIVEKMDAKKEARAKGQAKRDADGGAGAGDDDDAPDAVPLDGSPERRLTAKASTRARRRIA